MPEKYGEPMKKMVHLCGPIEKTSPIQLQTRTIISPHNVADIDNWKWGCYDIL